MNNYGKTAVILSIFSLVLYPISDIICIGICIAALLFAILGTRDLDTIQKTMQPALVVGGVFTLKGVLGLIIGVIQNIAMMRDSYYSSNLYNNISVFNHILTVILYVFVFVCFVLTVIFFSMGKDVPVVGKISKTIIQR